MARISGRALLGVLKYAKEIAGSDGRETLLAGLPEDDRRIFAKPLRVVDWYPYSAYSGLLENLGGWPGRGHSDSLVDLGHWGLGRDARTVLKILSIFSSVEGLVSRGFGSWGGFLWRRHCDTGEVFLAGSGHRTASMGLRGFAGVSPHHCQVICGYLEAMGEAVGARRIHVTETRCVHRGDSHCEYRGQWD